MESTQEILLCGATGDLGGAIARHLAGAGVHFRALVRQTTDAAQLSGVATEIVRGDIRDPASLRTAVAGITTIISTVNAMGRLLAGAHDMTIHDVDEVGYANLITMAEEAGVSRFIYLSALGDQKAAHTPFTDAKAATEQRLRASSMQTVIVRPDAFREVWLGPAGGFDVDHGKVTIYGRGHARRRFVATEDVAEAVVRLALAENPPEELELAGAEPMSPEEAVVALERELGRSLRTTHVPRAFLRAGRLLARRVKPELASIMGMALAGDLADTAVGPEGFRSLGIEPQPLAPYIRATAASA